MNAGAPPHLMNYFRRLADGWNQCWRFACGEHCQLKDAQVLIYKSPFKYLSIGRDEIVRWRVIPEMGADFVQLQLRDGTVQWLTDKRNDVIEVLTLLVPDKKFGDELDLL